MITPTVVVLPQPAYRLSWLAARLEHVSRNLVFESLFQQISPEALARLHPARQPIDTYNALLCYIDAHLFPVATGLDFSWAEEEEEIDDVGEALFYGIPISVFGYDYDILRYRGYSPCIALMHAITHPEDYTIEKMLSLEKYLSVLKPLPAMPTRAELIKCVRPPRGRAWRAPWDGLSDLFDFCISDTGNPFLDYSALDIAEMGNNPPWHIEEIRGLTAYWNRAKPIWDRIQTLRDYIDARPKSRLPQLLKALTGHEPTRQHLSQPKAEKTLVDILT